MMQPFDPLTIDINNINLIEASAGTGKTYTISILYLRAILNQFGHSDLNHKAIDLSHILVVTFTNAATKELRQRLKEKLIDAKKYLQGIDIEDDCVKEIIHHVENQENALWSLDLAIQSMDLAEIHTIHGFCQRILQQYSFEMSCFFDHEFILDESKLQKQACEDFWRQYIVDLERPFLDILFSTTKITTPEKLSSELNTLLRHNHLKILPTSLNDTLESLLIQIKQQVKTTKKAWLNDDIENIMLKCFAKNTKQAKAVNLELMRHWASTDLVLPIDQRGLIELAIWSDSIIHEKKAKHPVPELEAFSQVARLNALLLNFKGVLLKQSLNFTKQWLLDHKRQHKMLTPDDLLKTVYHATSHGHRNNLIHAVGTQFPIVFVDEFQDTDPIQYGIFENLFHKQAHKAIFYIGDPKQAIYSFRGADINTYIAAKNAIPPNYQFTLDKNWRSSPAMVASTNYIFQQHPKIFDEHATIGYHHVSASERYSKSQFIVDGKKQNALEIIVLDMDSPITSKETFREIVAQENAKTIVHWLNAGQTGRAFIDGIPLRANHIAILVRDRLEADSMKRALSACGVSSAFLSKDSVFSSEIAMDIYWLLHACAIPSETNAIIAALSSYLFGFSLKELQHQLHDESQWLHWASLFHDYHIHLNQFGAYATLMAIAQEHHFFSRWLASSEGMRHAIEYQHIAELLENQHYEEPSYSQLTHWLSQKISGALAPDNSERSRLYNDQSIITIATIHASKGLEYPVVLLPFACSGSPAQSPIYFDDIEKALVYDMDSNEASLKIAEKERLAEDIRLFYVALTRAKFHCSVTSVDYKHAKHSAWHYILGLNHDSPCLSQITDLANNSNKHIHLAEHKKIDSFKTQDSDFSLTLETRKLTRKRLTTLSTMSYSSITRHSSQPVFDEKDRFDIETHKNDDTVTFLNKALSPLNFPKGPHIGVFLHYLLETLSFDSEESIREKHIQSVFELETQLSWENTSEALEVLKQWINDVLKTPLNTNSPTFQLQKISQSNRVDEMEFLMSCKHLSTETINQILAHYRYPTFISSTSSSHMGFLKGFIDLVCKFDNKFYIIDYKSNYLGESREDYSSDCINKTMSDNQYHLQYLIYTVAFVRWASNQRIDFNYETDFGGVYYLFLRGMNGINSETGVYFDKPNLSCIQALSECL